MNNKIKTEIHNIVDTLLLEVNNHDCATVPQMTIAIVKHPKFLDYAAATPELEMKIKYSDSGATEEIFFAFDLGRLIKNRLHWNFRNLKDENGSRVFYQFEKNSRTGKSRYIPPHETETAFTY
ncbi:MAG: hypothetical protein ACR2L1_03495 [Pyrinomonadaceae bacterium]